MVQVLVKFGCEEERYYTVTIGMNEKGGMDNEEFEKYTLYLIYNIFPDVADKPSKIVLININSGPGLTNTNFMESIQL